MSARPLLGFLGIVLRTQWVDRRATSTFVVAATVQTGVLALALATAAHPRLVDAVRVANTLGIAIVVLAAMSAVQNEFRYRTIWVTFASPRRLLRLVVYRSLATAILCGSVIAVPLVVAVVRGAQPVVAALAAGAVALSLVTCGYVAAVALALTTAPRRLAPWTRLALLGVGAGSLPWPLPEPVRLILPTGWPAVVAEGRGLGLLIVPVCAAWLLGTRLLLAPWLSHRLRRLMTEHSELT